MRTKKTFSSHILKQVTKQAVSQIQKAMAWGLAFVKILQISYKDKF
jgi:hypothetical protein